MLDLYDEFRAILAALEREGVEFAVCGALAVAIHARPRATVDVDLLVPREAMNAAKAVVRALGYTIEARPMRLGEIEIERLSKPDPESGDLLSVDLLRVTAVLDPVWSSRERVQWEHGAVPVVSREGLIRMKRLRGSGLDLDDIRALEEARGD